MTSANRRASARWAAVALTIGLLALGFLVELVGQPEAAPANSLRVSVLDVGQGDAILIDVPTGEHILVDGGPGAGVIVPLSRVLAIPHKFALVVASHNHADHIGGLPAVLSEYPVDDVWLSGALHTSDTFLRWLEAVRASGARTRTAYKGVNYDIGAVHVQVLHPLEDMREQRPSHQHDPTLVLKVSYGATSILLTGDLEAEHEAALLDADRAALRSDVLKVTHHGSRYASTNEFLAAVDADIALISVGQGNKFDHPHPETLERLAGSGAEIFRTDQDGTITCTSDGLEFRCDGER